MPMGTLHKIYKLANLLPFPVEVKILGNGPSFPKVCKVPAPPLPPVPIPYPDIAMNVQIKMPNGSWSPTQKLKWKPGSIALPKLF